MGFFHRKDKTCHYIVKLTKIFLICFVERGQVWVMRILHMFLCNVNNCGLQESGRDSNFARSFLHSVETRIDRKNNINYHKPFSQSHSS